MGSRKFKLNMRILMFAVLFLLVGAFFIIGNENLHLANKAEAKIFLTGYFSWFGELFSNAGGLAGYAIKSDWLPSSESNSTS